MKYGETIEGEKVRQLERKIECAKRRFKGVKYNENERR